MARFVVRSKSHQKLRETARDHHIDKKTVSNETSSRPAKSAAASPSAMTPPLPTSRFASPASTSSFEVLSRPKTANAAMEEARKRNLMAMGDPIILTSADGKETFNFPTPIREGPQPVLMSRYAASPLAIRPGLERSATPETIGMALGSPSHLAQFEREAMAERLYASSKEGTPAGTPKLGEDVQKPKISRWKSIFGKKTQQSSGLRSQDEKSPAMPAGTQPRAGLGLNNYHTWDQQSPWSPRLRSDTVPRYDASPQAPPKSPRWNLGRSQTAPTGRRNPNSPPTPPKDFLSVEIPETKMERYSIMFNGIIANQPGGLLARRASKRQSKTPEQPQPTTIEDLDIPPVPKRANTSASPSKGSPSYRLLVFPPGKNTPSPKTPKELGRKPSLLHRPRPKNLKLKRSNTAPGALSPGLLEKRGPLSPMSEMSESAETPRDTSAPSSAMIREMEEEMAALDHDMGISKDEAERQALTPTPSEPSTPTTPPDSKPLPLPISTNSFMPFSSVSQNDHARKSSTNLSMMSKMSMSQPDWEMITIGKLAEPGDRFSGAQVRVVEEPSPIDRSQPMKEATWHPLRMNSLVDKKGGNGASAAARDRAVERAVARANEPLTRARATSNATKPIAPAPLSVKSKTKENNASKAPTVDASKKPLPDLTATMATQRLPAKGEVQIARSMSVTKTSGARPVLRTSPRGVERTKGENLVERKAMVPIVVNVPTGSNSPKRGHKPAKSFSASIVEETAA